MAQEFWTRTHYTLLQLVLTREFLALYQEDGQDGMIGIWTPSLDAVGVATATTETYEGRGSSSRKVRERSHNCVVGLCLVDGAWEIADEADNYLGMCRLGDDIRLAANNAMAPEDLKRLRPEFVLPPENLQ